MKANRNLTSLGQFIDKEYGMKGTAKRDKLEAEYESFKLEVLIQQATQEKEIDLETN
jgi:HTH-type transcriptional regulator/antitoxin HipB